ncbi:hypothetical protein D3C72_1873690 [compost metagenome]
MWRQAPAEILTDSTLLQPMPRGLTVVFALRGAAELSDPQETVALDPGDCALLDAPARFTPEDGSAILVVRLHAVSST